MINVNSMTWQCSDLNSRLVQARVAQIRSLGLSKRRQRVNRELKVNTSILSEIFSYQNISLRAPSRCDKRRNDHLQRTMRVLAKLNYVGLLTYPLSNYEAIKTNNMWPVGSDSNKACRYEFILSISNKCSYLIWLAGKTSASVWFLCLKRNKHCSKKPLK